MEDNDPRHRWGRLGMLAKRFGVAIVGGLLAACACESILRSADVFPDSWPAAALPYYNTFVNAFIYAQENDHYVPQSTIPIYADGRVVVNHVDRLGYIGANGGPDAPDRLLVFGDSFAYGFGVGDGQSFARLLHGYNAGLWGQPFPAHCRVFRRLAPLLRPTVAIWTIYAPHLLTCTPEGWNSRARIDSAQHPFGAWLIGQFNRTKLSSLVVKTTGLACNRTAYESLEWRLYDVRDAIAEPGYQQFETAARTLVRDAAKDGVTLVAVFVPSKSQVGLKIDRKRPLLYPWAALDADLPTARLSRILVDCGLPLEQQVNLMAMMQAAPAAWRTYYFRNDAHFSVSGNAAVAEYVRERMARITRTASRAAQPRN